MNGPKRSSSSARTRRQGMPARFTQTPAAGAASWLAPQGGRCHPAKPVVPADFNSRVRRPWTRSLPLNHHARTPIVVGNRPANGCVVVQQQEQHGSRYMTSPRHDDKAGMASPHRNSGHPEVIVGPAGLHPGRPHCKHSLTAPHLARTPPRSTAGSSCLWAGNIHARNPRQTRKAMRCRQSPPVGKTAAISTSFPTIGVAGSRWCSAGE